MIDPELPERHDPRMTTRELRQFAGLCVLVFGGLFVAGVVRHGGWPSPAGVAAGAIALLVGLPGLVRPSWVRPLYATALVLTRPIGHVVGFVALAIVFYGLITPLGLLFRLRGRDALALRRRPCETYWVPRNQTVDIRRYLRQYQTSAVEARSRAPEPGPARDPVSAPVAKGSAATSTTGEPHDGT